MRSQVIRFLAKKEEDLVLNFEDVEELIALNPQPEENVALVSQKVRYQIMLQSICLQVLSSSK